MKCTMRADNPFFDRLPPLEKGSQWIAITDRMRDFIFDYLAVHPDFIPAFRYSHAADELFFHTLLGDSPFAGYNANYSLVHADWSHPGAHPKTLSTSDLSQLSVLKSRGGGNSRIPNDIAILGVDNDETICKLSTPNLSSLNQGVEQGGYDVARLIDRLIRNPEAEWEDVMVMPTHIVTRQSTDIYANNDPHIAEVLRYIHENISQKITVNELVKLVPLSRRLLETRFKKSMGTSIYDYIIQVRIEKMMQLLCEGQSVSEAAAELGFSDIKNVSRTFRQLKGITPSEYREQFAPKRR